MSELSIDGELFPVPDEDDWELGELAEFTRLRDQWGDLGATIAMVWIVKHRRDPSFTVEQAKQVKVGQIDTGQEADGPVPLESPALPRSSGSGSEPSESEPSETPAGFGSPS